MKRIVSVISFIALIIVASCLFSCGSAVCDECVDLNGDGVCDNCKKDMLQDGSKDVVLFSDGEPTFQIVVAKDASYAVRQSVNTTVKAALRNLYGIAVNVVVEGNENDTETDVEVLVGEVKNRGADYVYVIKNTSLNEISDGNHHDSIESYGGFYGDTRFIYGKSAEEYFLGSDHSGQKKTNVFSFE